jgi:hypothetical protein
MTTILAAGALTSFGAITMTITGDTDWDTSLFTSLKAGTISENEAKALWTYTDGYKVNISGSNTSIFNPAGLGTQTGGTLPTAASMS